MISTPQQRTQWAYDSFFDNGKPVMFGELAHLLKIVSDGVSKITPLYDPAKPLPKEPSTVTLQIISGSLVKAFLNIREVEDVEATPETKWALAEIAPQGKINLYDLGYFILLLGARINDIAKDYHGVTLNQNANEDKRLKKRIIDAAALLQMASLECAKPIAKTIEVTYEVEFNQSSPRASESAYQPQ